MKALFLALGVASVSTSKAESLSLWTRMGDEPIIRPLASDIYDLHASDNITKGWFESTGPHPWNIHNPDQVKEYVFTFFSAGIGGPYPYNGRSMVEAHAKIFEHKPLTKAAIHAVVYHVLRKMKAHGAGGDAEIEEVHDILFSLVPDVAKFGTAVFEGSTTTLWDRLGGEVAVKPIAEAIYNRHASDPLTAPWFAPVAVRKPVVQELLRSFHVGVESPLLLEAYTGAKKTPFTKAATHALAYHIISVLKSRDVGERELDEALALFHGLRTQSHTKVWTFEELTNVTPLQAFFGWVALFLLLVWWRQREALDSSTNNTGIFAWSGVFYAEGGPLTDFINALPYVMNLVPTATVGASIYLWQVTGNDAFTFFTFIAGFGLVPVLDLIVGEDSYNPTPAEESALRKNPWFRFWTCSYVHAYVANLLFVLKLVGEKSAAGELSTLAFLGISISVGTASGFGIGCIHELIHRPSFLELNHARVVLLFSNYNHFWVEHLWGHHKRVATEEDPASSALNESLWTFIWKCLWLSLVSAFRLEKKFLANQGKNFFSTSNRLVPWFIGSFAIDYAVYHFWGPYALGAQLIQSFLTAFLTDNTNYIEHYGLRRERLSDVKDEWGWYSDYEQPGWMHAWNTGDRITNWILFKIERHPDHHVNAGRPYQILRTFKESPTYPTGYTGMILLSWFPPLFFFVMNPLVEKAKADLINLRKTGEYDKLFPKGANNVSSVFKKTGEDYFESGSSEYGGQVDNDNDGAKGNVGGAVWGVGEAKEKTAKKIE